MPASTQSSVHRNHARTSDEMRSFTQDIGLAYTTGMEPGIRRKRSKSSKKYSYLDARGSAVTDERTLARIRSLAIPPAWKDVWICVKPSGHVQAIGFDARGRKQYRYHPQWRQERDRIKYCRMVPFAQALPRIRERVRRDLRATPLSRNQVLAVVVHLLEQTLIRIGNDEYARENDSYGLTTLQGRHIEIRGSTIRFRFRGKSGKWRELTIQDAAIASIMRQCRTRMEEDVFRYLDDAGNECDVTSHDVNAYLKEISGVEISAKDFRTWAGTLHAALTLECSPPCSTKSETKRAVVSALEFVSGKLGNTPAVCRKSYVHPVVIECFESQCLAPRLQKHASDIKRGLRGNTLSGLSIGEAAVLRFLKESLA